MLTSRSSLPSDASRHFTSRGRASSEASSVRIELSAPSRWCKKYSLPFADDPIRLARHTVSTRGQFSSASGSSIAKFTSPESSFSFMYTPADLPEATMSSPRSRLLRSNVGYEGIHPARADWAMVSIDLRPLNRPSPSGDEIASGPKLSYRHWPVLTYQKAVPIIWRGGRIQSNPKVSVAHPVSGRIFSWPT